MTDSAIIKILREWNIGDVLRISLIPIGMSSKNWKVETSSGFYFLKMHRASGGGRIESIERVEEYFCSHGIPVLTPLRTRDGISHVFQEGAAYVLYPFVSGQSFDFGKAPRDALRNMGEMLAKMHLLTKDGIKGSYADVSTYFLSPSPDKLIADIDRFLLKISHLASKTEYDHIAEEGLALKKKMVLKHAEGIKRFTFDTLTLGHGDYHPSNIFFKENMSISAIFDLDMSGPMPRMYEFARSLYISCFEYAYTEEGFEQAAIFAKAYFEEYPFEKEELRKGVEAVFFKMFSVWRERAHYEEHDFRSDLTYPPSIRNMVYLDSHKEEFIERLHFSLL
jgi:Ser/Thr protein kinase RdoA (MazF antagonist)